MAPADDGAAETGGWVVDAGGSLEARCADRSSPGSVFMDVRSWCYDDRGSGNVALQLRTLTLRQRIGAIAAPLGLTPEMADFETTASPHDTATWFEQGDYAIRFGWGPNALRRLAPAADVVIIVDVLSFSTSVDIAIGRGAVVLPYKWHDGSEHEYAAAHDAIVAERGRWDHVPGRLTLSPASLTAVDPDTRLVLPSANGSALTFGAKEAGAAIVRVACLRNASAVAAASAGVAVSVIAAGERWRGATGPLRPAYEDMLGAGAIISALGLDGASPEARSAAAVFEDARGDVRQQVMNCGSGRELRQRGSIADVELAVMLDASDMVPTLDGVTLMAG